jgi:hypothetical protein
VGLGGALLIQSKEGLGSSGVSSLPTGPDSPNLELDDVSIYFIPETIDCENKGIKFWLLPETLQNDFLPAWVMQVSQIAGAIIICSIQ